MNNTISNHMLQVLEWPTIHDTLIQKCTTEPGQQRAENIEALKKNEIELQLKKISQMKEALDQGLKPDFTGISDINQMLIIAEKEGLLSLENLSKIRTFILASKRIKKYLIEIKDEFPILGNETHNLDNLNEIGNILIPAITDTNEINDATFPSIKIIKDDIFSIKNEIEKSLTSLMTSIDNILQEKIISRRNDRYVLLIKSNMRSKIKGNVQDISASGQTVYLEPGVVTDLNNKLIILERELQLEINKIIKELTIEVAKNSGMVRHNQKSLGYLDFLTGCSTS